jgi:ADP-heptose:LPS heptosyltransferase
LPDIKKILVIRFSSFGDIVLTYPFLTLLRKYFPSARIDYLTKSAYAPLVKMHGSTDNIIEFKNEKIGELRNIIKKNNYDLIFDLHKNIRSVFSTLFTKPEKIRYKKNTIKKLLLAAFKINLLDNIVPVYKTYINALSEIHFQENMDLLKADLIFDNEPAVKEPYILIAPSSKHFTKTLPKDKFEEIIKEVKNKKIVLIGDRSFKDMELCVYLEKISPRVINLCGKTNYNTLANLIFNCDLVICNDSGVLHLAEALDKKIIVFFGSTVKEFGFYPQLESTVVFENNNLKCRPCTHIGKAECPKKHFKCMNDINVNEIINKINENIS